MEVPAINDDRRVWSPADLVYSVLQYRWWIIGLAAFGVLIAAGLYFLRKPLYQSEAKLLVRYIVNRSAVDPVESQSQGSLSGKANSVVQSELEILTSWDLALHAANAVGLEHLVSQPGAPGAANLAAARVQSGLSAMAGTGGNVISVTYRDSDPAVTVAVLQRLITLYFDKHLEVHRSIGGVSFVNAQSRDIQKRLDETERQLKELKTRAQVFTLSDSSGAFHTDMIRREAELDAARADLAAQRALVAQIERQAEEGGAVVPTRDTGERIRYNLLLDRLKELEREQMAISTVYNPESARRKGLSEQIVLVTGQLREMEAANPRIADTRVNSGGPQVDESRLINEKATLAALDARVTALDEQLRNVREQARQLAEIAPQVAQLERRRAMEAEQQKYVESTLERARIDGALDPSKIPNISIVQNPSPARPNFGTRDKVALIFAGGGLALGCGLALLFGVVFDRTIKQPFHIEERAGLSFLASIPLVRRKTIRWPRGKSPRWGPGPRDRSDSALERAYESIRDRLLLSLDLSEKKDAPKLIALTGCVDGAGTSTIAAGLAQALCRVDRGKVLLVDMNQNHIHLKSPVEGQAAIPVTDLMSNGNHGHNGSNGGDSPTSGATRATSGFSVATTATVPAELQRPLAAQIRDLLPHLRTREFSYVIVDLPSVANSSAALIAAAFVDKVLLIVPGEKVTPSVLRSAYNDLVESRGDVSIVFNQERFPFAQRFALAN